MFNERGSSKFEIKSNVSSVEAVADESVAEAWSECDIGPFSFLPNLICLIRSLDKVA